ncbi:MAG: hypothetical protein ABW067_08795 [Rhizobacter sp.]
MSSIRRPAACTACGGLSAVPVVNASGILAGCAVLLTAAGFLAVALRSGAVFWVAMVAVAAVYLWRWHVAPLTPISADQSRSARALAESASWLAFIIGLISR